MRSVTAFILLASLVSLVAASYEGYQVWRIRPTTEKQMKWLSEIEERMGDELDFWTAVSKIPGHPVDIMVQPDRQSTLRMLLNQEKLDFDVMIDDVNTLVSNQMAEILERRERGQPIGTNLHIFNYNVYHDYDEIQNWVADIANEHSAYVSTFVLGNSYEGRQINGIRIRGSGDQTETRPAIWFQGGIHAREWVSPSTVMGFTYLLLNEYRNGDQLAQKMFNNIDWYIVPSLNADGYVHTWVDDRMWRKTRSNNVGSFCVGTDPNRNWPFQWGGPGASTSPCSETYRGSGPLSEIEVANVVQFIGEKQDAGQEFKVFIDWHSYTQKIIAPWSYLATNARTVDYDDQMDMAIAMSDAIKATHGQTYEYGVSAEILYQVSGASKDYGYTTDGGAGAKYSYTVELRDTGRYGFLLPENQIQPTYEEIHAAVRVMGNRVLSEMGI